MALPLERRMALACAAVVLAVCATVAFAEPLTVTRLRDKFAAESGEPPSFRCTQIVERSVEGGAVEKQRQTVTFVDGQESTPLAPTLRDLLEPGAAEFSELPGPGAGFRFEVPREESRLRLGPAGAQVAVAFHGSVLLDPETLDLVKMEIVADVLPDGLGILSQHSVIEYHRVTSGTAQILVPASAEIDALNADTSLLKTRAAYTGCETLDVLDLRALPLLPRGLLLEVEPASTVKLADSAVGDRVELVLRRAVSKGRNVQLPKGASLTGHISRLRHQVDVVGGENFAYYILGLEFDRIEGGGKAWRVCTTVEDVRSIDNKFAASQVSSDFERRARAYQAEQSEPARRSDDLMMGRRRRLWGIVSASVGPAAACEGFVLSSVDPPEISRGVILQLQTRSK